MALGLSISAGTPARRTRSAFVRPAAKASLCRSVPSLNGLAKGGPWNRRERVLKWSCMLRISKLTDYATVILAAMAQDPKHVYTAAALAEQTRVAAPTVSKLLKQLQ